MSRPPARSAGWHPSRQPSTLCGCPLRRTPADSRDNSRRPTCTHSSEVRRQGRQFASGMRSLDMGFARPMQADGNPARALPAGGTWARMGRRHHRCGWPTSGRGGVRPHGCREIVASCGLWRSFLRRLLVIPLCRGRGHRCPSAHAHTQSHAQGQAQEWPSGQERPPMVDDSWALRVSLTREGAPGHVAWRRSFESRGACASDHTLVRMAGGTPPARQAD
jgi:hypothetical protein